MPEDKAEPVVRFDKVDIVFGNQPKGALAMMDEGKTRADGNHSRPRWVEAHGRIDGKPSGVTVASASWIHLSS